MSDVRTRGKVAVNSVARLFGVRLVNANWGPRGFCASLERARAKGFLPRTVIDIGAATGTWTRECRSVFPAARYFLVDPLEENRPALERLALSDARISVWTGALGADPGEQKLWAHGDQSSFLHSRDFPGTPRTVEVRTLDSFIEPFGLASKILLKADVQGFELEVLKGASRCLEMAELLVIEVSFRQVYIDGPLAHQVIAYLGAHGFRIYDISSFLQRPTDGELLQCDIVFARNGSQLFSPERWNGSP